MARGRSKKRDNEQWSLSDVDDDFPMPPLESYRVFHVQNRGEKTVQISGRVPEELVVQVDDLVAEARMRGLDGLKTRADVVKVAVSFFTESLLEYLGKSDSAVMFFTRQREFGRRARDMAALSEIKRNVALVIQGWIYLCDEKEFVDCSLKMSSWLSETVLEESGLVQRLYLKALDRHPVFHRAIDHLERNDLITSEIDSCLDLIDGLDKGGGVSGQ